MHWAIVVLLLYAALVIALAGPVVLLAFAPDVPVSDVIGMSTEPDFWLTMAVVVGVLTLCEAGLLLVPVRAASGRPVTRMSLLWPALATGFFAGLLVAGALASIAEFVLLDSAQEDPWFVAVIAAGGLVWLVWAVVFWTATRRPGSQSVGSACRALFTGSILELLVAVPTHVVARCRDYCCAGFLTFFGLAAGLAVMLFAFGPGVYFLFRRRWLQLHPES